MSKNATPMHRIAALEAEIRRVRAQLHSLRREAQGGMPHYLRIAKTTTAGTYPASPANTYDVVAEEIDFESVPGYQTPTITPLSAGPQFVGHDPAPGEYLDEDTRVLALRQPNAKRLVMPFTPPCCGCTFMADDFNRADSTNVGSKWTEVSGDWEILDNQLRAESDGDLIIATKPYDTPNAMFRARVSADSSITDPILNPDGDRVRLIIDYDNANNYHFVEVRFWTILIDPPRLDLFIRVAACRLGKRSGGVDAYLTPESDPLEITAVGFLDVQICIKDAHLQWTATAGVGNRSGGEANSTPHGGRQCGFALVDDNPTDFDFAILGKHSADNLKCLDCISCGGCLDVTVPKQWQVKLSGFSDKFCGLQNCADLNGTFLLDFAGHHPVNVTCEWIFDLGHNICDGSGVGWRYVVLSLAPIAGTPYLTIDVAVRNANQNNHLFIWSKTWNPAVQCDFVDEVITNTGAGSLTCETNGDDALITAVH